MDVACNPTMAPPIAFGLNPSSFTARTRADCAPWASGTSPLQQARLGKNGFAERLIGSIRRECLDQMIVWSEAHLRRVLKEYTSYYNAARTHLGLQKDTPIAGPLSAAAASSPTTSWVDFTINSCWISFSEGTSFTSDV